MKYRKKPVVVEAMQFTDANKNEVLSWARGIQYTVYAGFYNAEPVIRIPTLEGEMTARFGDYIIKGVSGEIYPCKPDIFKKTYDPVEE